MDDKTKKTLIFYEDWLTSIEHLPKDKQARLVFDLLQHVLRGEPAPDDDLSKMFFGFTESQLQRDWVKYDDIRQKRSEAGRRHKGNQYTKRNKMEQNGTNGTNGTVDVDVDVDDNVDDNVDVDVDVDDTNKINNCLKKLLKKAAPEMRAIWDEWCRYRVSAGKPFATEMTAQKQFEQLMQLSGGDRHKAKAIVDQAIAGGYTGLREPENYTDPYAEYPVLGEDGKHYPTMYDEVRRQNAYEDQ